MRKTLESPGQAVIPRPSRPGRVSASRPNCSPPCARPPPRSLNRSRRTADRQAEVLRSLGKRIGGLRCSRAHPGAGQRSPAYRQREDVGPTRQRLPGYHTCLPPLQRPHLQGSAALPIVTAVTSSLHSMIRYKNAAEDMPKFRTCGGRSSGAQEGTASRLSCLVASPRGTALRHHCTLQPWLLAMSNSRLLRVVRSAGSHCRHNVKDGRLCQPGG
jgi:hypothetical protein